jgi:parallel beta-helix repeat protein
LVVGDARDSSGQLTGNVANGNTNSGIVLVSSDVNPAKNRASFNGDFGIRAVPGTTDGGKNIVQDNVNQVQCLNIACVEVSS